MNAHGLASPRLTLLEASRAVVDWWYFVNPYPINLFENQRLRWVAFDA